MTETRGRVARPSPGHLALLGRWCARHARVVIALWLAVLVAATLGHRALGSGYADDFTLAGSPAGQGAALLRAFDPAASGPSGQLVFTVGAGTVAGHRSVVEGAADRVRALPHVLSVSDPLRAATTSRSGRTAYATVHFSVNPVTLGAGYVHQVDRATAAARAAGVEVDYGGLLGQAARPSPRDTQSEAIGVAVALVVLLVGFGSVYAAGLPILSSLIGAVAGLGVLGAAASAVTFASVAPTLGIMMGLGVGIDYGLFLTTRHRQLVMDGVEPSEAAGRTVGSSGRSVLVAAGTVVIALLGLYASGIGFIGRLGLAAAITVVVAAASAVTLTPALLGAAGRRLDRWAVRRPVAEASTEHAGWHRYAERIGTHPWRYLLGGVALLALLSVPALSLRLGHVGAGADPPSYTDRRAYDALAEAFGPGANGPFTIVADLAGSRVTTPAAERSLAVSLREALAATPGVASVGRVRSTPGGRLLSLTVLARTGPQAAATDRLQTTLQDRTLPRALAGSGARGYVTGTLAGQLDFRDRVAARLPTIIATVVGAAFLLLLASFRSPVLAAKAAVLNLLSIAASYGVIVAVFQWGWGSSWLGVGENVPIESYVPMVMFAIVFGLSMDYEVFLLSRVREVWARTGDNHASVAGGLAATARVIGCAALIMTSVFLAFLLSSSVVVKMLALGLGVSILIDASVIRLLVVPATMFLLGRANWWSPAWLDRVLPELLERGAAEEQAPVAPGVPSGGRVTR